MKDNKKGIIICITFIISIMLILIFISINKIKTNNEESKITKKWEDLPTSIQFQSVRYNDNTYSSQKAEISGNNINEKIGEETLTGSEYSVNKEGLPTQIKHNNNAYLYSIKDIPEKCAIAVRFQDDYEYYIFVNSLYKPLTLGEFIKDLNLEKNISFGTIYYSYWDKDTEKRVDLEFHGVDKDIIWHKLFNNQTLENIYNLTDDVSSKYSSNQFSRKFSISVDIPLLGVKNKTIQLTDKGYLITNILDTGKCFYIGEDKVQEFINYVRQNYNGQKNI